jgi:hypothetical protein
MRLCRDPRGTGMTHKAKFRCVAMDGNRIVSPFRRLSACKVKQRLVPTTDFTVHPRHHQSGGYRS